MPKGSVTKPDRYASGANQGHGRMKPLHLALWLLIPLAFVYVRELIDYLPRIHGIFDDDSRMIGRDFANWWTAARLTLDGQVMTLFDFDNYHDAMFNLFQHETEFKNWSYPPHVIPWLLWLGIMPYPWALAEWVVVTFTGYAVANAFGRPRPWTIVLFLLMAPSTCINVIEAQTGFLIAALLVGGLRLLERAPLSSGVLFGILTIKPQFGILLPFALIEGRYRRTIAMTIVTAVLLIGFSILMFGLEPWRAYFNTTVPYQREVLQADLGGEIYQSMMISPFMAVRILGGSVHHAWQVTAAASLLSLAAVIYVFMSTRSVDLRAAVIITATFFGSPYMLSYDTPAVSAAVLAMVIFASDEGRPLKWFHYALFFIVWMEPLFIIPMNHSSLPFYPLTMFVLLIVQVLWAARPVPNSRTAIGQTSGASISS